MVLIIVSNKSGVMSEIFKAKKKMKELFFFKAQFQLTLNTAKPVLLCDHICYQRIITVLYVLIITLPKVIIC